MWTFYYELADAAYQEPSDIAVFVLIYCLMAACVLAPPFLERKRDESR